MRERERQCGKTGVRGCGCRPDRAAIGRKWENQIVTAVQGLAASGALSPGDGCAIVRYSSPACGARERLGTETTVATAYRLVSASAMACTHTLAAGLDALVKGLS